MDQSLVVFRASAAIAARGFNFDLRAANLLRAALRRLPLLLVPAACLLAGRLAWLGPWPQLALPAAAAALAWHLAPRASEPLRPPLLGLVDRLFYPFLSVTLAQHVLRPSEARSGRARRWLADDRHVVRLLYPELDLDFRYRAEPSDCEAADGPTDWRLAPNVRVRVEVADAGDAWSCHLRDLALRVWCAPSLAPAAARGPLLLLRRAPDAPAGGATYDTIQYNATQYNAIHNFIQYDIYGTYNAYKTHTTNNT